MHNFLLHLSCIYKSLGGNTNTVLSPIMAKARCIKVLPKNTATETNIHKLLKISIIVANCFGLLPVDGITSDSPDGLRFKWCSLKTFWALHFLLVVIIKMTAKVIVAVTNSITVIDST